MAKTSHSFSRSRLWRVVLLALTVGVTGCAVQNERAIEAPKSDGSVIVGAEQGRKLSEQLNAFLSRSGPGETIQPAQSPWGSGVRMTAQQPYYAASGRICRELRIQDADAESPRRLIACETADKDWVTRPHVAETPMQGGSQ